MGGVLGTQDVTVTFVIGALLAVGGFGILAVEAMIVVQKRRDIAIMRSFGVSRAGILAAFLLQGFAIATAGALVGEVLSGLLLMYLRTVHVHLEGAIKTDTLLIRDDVRSYLYSAAASVVLGLAAAFVPAWRAAQVEPVDVLRGQIG